MEEKEAEAELNFKAIKDQVQVRDGKKEYHYSEKNFVEQNI